MKRILVVSLGNSVRGPIAKSLIEKLRKCDAEIYSFGIAPVALHPFTVKALEAIGMVSKNSDPVDIDNTEFDYVITVCDEAKTLLPKLKGQPLIFHYHFNTPAKKGMQDAELLNEFGELISLMKMYFERFCRIYLNEFV